MVRDPRKLFDLVKGETRRPNQATHETVYLQHCALAPMLAYIRPATSGEGSLANDPT